MRKIPTREDHPGWVVDNIPSELATSTLFRFKIKLQARSEEDSKDTINEVIVDLLPDLDLDYDRLEEQLSALPAQYAYWAAVYSELRLNVAIAERKLKARRGRVMEMIQKEARENNVKLNEFTLRTIIESDKRLNEAEVKFLLAQMHSGKLYHMLEALKMKSDLGRSLLGLKKQELERT